MESPLILAESPGLGTPVHWAGFIVLVLGLLSLDLGVFHRQGRIIRIRESLLWTLVWVGLAGVFNVWLYWGTRSVERALEFTAGYLVEESLSVDNLFIFLLIFRHFQVPGELQHRVLYWGILGAIVMRLGFILIGSAVVQMFHWVLFFFGGLLIITGIRLLFHKAEETDFEMNFILRCFRKFIPMTPGYRGTQFFLREGGRLLATPLFAVLIVVETTDLAFAIDSIPAVFGVVKSRDPFIIFTSNVFAILGLRSLYFLLAGFMDRFHHLKVGLSLVLMFIGVKMFLDETRFEVSIQVSLGVIAGILASAILASILLPKPPQTGPGEVEEN
ncbi:MAG: TerC family protein [Planctomycetes bacterium]|nr:TerC family protein [Planctomycetota bacterium]